MTFGGAALISGNAHGAKAQAWQVQYLELGAAHGPVQATKGEHRFTEAYFRFEDRTGIYISCIIRNERTIPRVFTYLRIANGEPFAGPKTNFHAVFEKGDELVLGEFSYAGGGYNGPLDPKTLAMMLSNSSVRVTNDTNAFDAEFPLEGVLDAVKQIECMDFRN